MQLVLHDPNQGPFLSKVLRFAIEEEILSSSEISAIKNKGVLMSLKLADKFYNKHKMHLLEQASQDVIGIASLGLMTMANHDQIKAILLLKKGDGLVKSFQKGWTMLATVSKYRLMNTKSVYGEVEKRLLNQISSPADTDEWDGWNAYQSALQEHLSQQAAEAIQSLYFTNSSYDPVECRSLEEMFSEALIYQIFFGSNTKVKEDLKKKISNIRFEPLWFSEDFVQETKNRMLVSLPEQLQQTLNEDLNAKFNTAIIRTLKFAQKYQQQLIAGASPEKLERLEHKEGMAGLLGWPLYLYL
ncbi:hypothetical protein D5R81_01865 [Parashewanella spongiae]|uniref:Uncharacterized protein n=1 Tax=Parashewanella spongiae TaxID=342950 RepID=A0A3A6U4Y2_9GAMM|nr:hypothetical protein [Parashewanella spongiae]MCL1076874.1 hypothetical protein [Parashewanella spongiae]RJY19241.1 hypothetical protein D5R81_01865 [Parashewanella spongiae]